MVKSLFLSLIETRKKKALSQVHVWRPLLVHLGNEDSGNYEFFLIYGNVNIAYFSDVAHKKLVSYMWQKLICHLYKNKKYIALVSS